MSYQLKIDEKSLNSARFISRLQNKIQKALIASGMTQQQVAEKLGVDRSVINRRLKGKTNLTARSIAEFGFAFDRDIAIDFVDRTKETQCNWSVMTKQGHEVSVPVTEGTSILEENTFRIESIAS